MWVFAVFTSILVHELGHALTSRLFGASPRIVLHGLGGATLGTVPQVSVQTRVQRSLIILAGPGAGFLLAGCIVTVCILFPPDADSTAAIVSSMFIQINLVWGIINLLPLLPLDGGQLVRVLLSRPGSAIGHMRALLVSATTGVIVALWCFKTDHIVYACFVGFLAFKSVSQLIGIRSAIRDNEAGLVAMIQNAERAMQMENWEAAKKLASTVAELAKARELRIAAIHCIAISLWKEQKPEEALVQLDNLQPHETEPMLYGECLMAVGRFAEAVLPFERAMERGMGSTARKRLIEALMQSGDTKRAELLIKQSSSNADEDGGGSDC